MKTLPNKIFKKFEKNIVLTENFSYNENKLDNRT